MLFSFFFSFTISLDRFCVFLTDDGLRVETTLELRVATTLPYSSLFICKKVPPAGGRGRAPESMGKWLAFHYGPEQKKHINNSLE